MNDTVMHRPPRQRAGTRMDAGQERIDPSLNRHQQRNPKVDSRYRVDMSLAEYAPEPDTGWMTYLKGIQRRPGWSAARLARESNGQISLSTVKRMAQGHTRRVDVATVRLVAAIVGDDPEAVLRQVVGSLIVESAPAAASDPRLGGLDPNDPIVRHIMGLEHVPEPVKTAMLARHRQKLLAWLRDGIEEVDFWAGQAGYLDELGHVLKRDPERD